MIKISVCQYKIERLSCWNSYEEKIKQLVIRAKESGADLLLLPEYAGIEIAGYHRSDKELYAALQPLMIGYCEFFKNLAIQYQIYIQPGTILFENLPDQYVNRAYFFGPDGKIGYQDKLQLTEYEKESKLIIRGNYQTLFETRFGKIGIAVCYDSEFPEIVRRLIASGAWLILVPSYTTTLAGYNRVFLSCRARALENQCYVAASFVVRSVRLSEPEETTFGQAAILGPVDKGFPDDGLIAQGKMNQISVISGDLSIEKLCQVRKTGHVHNFEDMQLCNEIKKTKLDLVSL